MAKIRENLRVEIKNNYLSPMKSDEKQVLNEWALQQSEFSKNDLLVSIHDAKTVPFAEIIALETIGKIISLSQNSIKESGINPLCQSIGKMNWEWNGTPVQTPIWIVPCSFKIDKVRKQVHLILEEENAFVNPFLSKKMAEMYSISLPETNLDAIIDVLQLAGFSDIDSDFSALGNFHHHRYALLKELQELTEKEDCSSSLKQFLSGEKSNTNTLHLPFESLLPADTDHQAVFRLFETQNCVVQGPPGTGKSQLLTNIVGKLLLSEQSHIFISEKRAALEVIKKRLSSSNLDQFCSIVTDDMNAHEFVQELKQTWLFLEEYQNETFTFSTKKELQDNLQFTLDLLNQPQLIGDVSFAKFNELLSLIVEQKNGSFQLLANPPSLIDFENTLSVVEQLYKQSLAESCSILPYSVFKEGNLTQLLPTIEKAMQLAQKFDEIQEGCTIQDFDKLHYLSVIYQLFQNELARKYAAIIEPESKAQAKFLKLYAEYNQLANRNNDINLTDWKFVPSIREVEVFLDEKVNFFQKIKLKKRWAELSHLPYKMRKESIEYLIKAETDLDVQMAVEDKLSKIGVTDLFEIDVLKASLHLFSKEKWNVYQQLTPKLKELLSEAHVSINQFKDVLKHTFRLNENQPILKQLSELKDTLSALIPMEQELKQLNQSILDALKSSATFSDYTSNILQSHKTIFSSHYPALSNFEPSSLKDKVEAVLFAETSEHAIVAQQIRAKLKQKFERYNQILNSPSAKLDSDEKELKKALKRGKSLLVKEFSKSKQHPTLRELLKSDAQLWIRLLKPVWLTNPVQLAKVVPLKKELFDVCIVDEASQIPVQNCVGALYRSKRAIIAGDEQQMNPTSYFQSGSKDVVSALHHASFYFSKTTLTHHYRSKHAPLIAFSNRYFYDNKLVVYPSFPVNNHCVVRHFCPEGIYVDRKNVVEAKRVVELLKSKLYRNKTIGVVAFSQEQVDTIWKAIPSDMMDEIENRIEENTFFIKPLEKVQGDECEHLIISLGYAPDEDGNFHMRFGPLNTESGRNRLNVLFSRASTSIDFVCSIEASALQWSDNESVQLLYKWLKFLEEPSENNALLFPLGLTPEVVGNKLKFKNSYASIPDALELQTTVAVLQNRGWDVEFC